MFHYSVSADKNIPIYRQLADQINAQVRSGALKTGTQLPTVREMAEKLRLSPGTVKKAYDCLQEMGDIEMTRRRGTFVKYVHRDKDSRKQQAMVAIDQMIRKLSELHFSPAEIQIFLNLKMREWGLKWTGVNVTVIAPCPEMAPVLKAQLEMLPNVQCTVHPMRQLQEYPYSVDEQSDVIAACARDEGRVAHLLPDGSKFVPVAFRPEQEGLLAALSCSGKRMGVYCRSEAFAELVAAALPDGWQLEKIAPPACVPERVEALIIPEGEEAPADFCGAVIPFAFRLDEGSMLYLDERIGKLRDERQQWPAAAQG